MYHVFLFNNNKIEFTHDDFFYFDNALSVLFNIYENDKHWYNELIISCIVKNGRVIARQQIYNGVSYER